MNASDPLTCHRILVIDDNPSIHDDIRKILRADPEPDPAFGDAKQLLFGHRQPGFQGWRFEIESAYQGRQGLEMVQEAVQQGRPFALAFVDVRMPPGWDGLLTVGHLWEASPDLQVVICTAYSDYSWEEMFHRLGKSESMVILKKPFDNIEVLQLAHALTAKWQLGLSMKRHLEELDRLVDRRTGELRAANDQLKQEILERSSMAASLQESEAQIRALLSATPDLIFSNRRDGEFLAFHASDPRRLLIPPEAFLHRNVLDVLPSPLGDRFMQFQATALATGLLQEFEYSLPMAGEDRHFEARVMPCTEDTVITIVRDISERKRAEERERHLEAQLRQAQRMESLGNLAGGVAHNMNNVLGAILGMASANLEAHSAGSPTHRAFDIIAKAAIQGGDMVKSLLSFARQRPAVLEVLDVNAILKEEVRLLEHTTLSKVRLELDLAVDLRPIRGEIGALMHAFMNLCVNAVDAMPGCGTLTLRTRNLDSRWIEVLVEDTGTGMPRSVLEKAMDPFFTTKPLGKGTGLGLSMVYSTVKVHEGLLEIQSEPGTGTRVSMRFPACEPAVPAEEPPVAPKAGSSRGALEVLLVDDDELIQDALQSMLEILGHHAVTALSGEEALQRLEAGCQPDVVILDMNMPGLGGSGTLPRLRALRPSVPVVLATGQADQATLRLIRAHAFVTLLAKPFSLAEIQQCFERLGRT